MDESNQGDELYVALDASVVRYTGGAVLQPHTHDAAGVSVVLAGSIEEKVGSRTEVGHVGSVVVKPAGLEHGNRVARDGAVLLAIKGREIDDLATQGWRWTRSSTAAAVGLRLARDLNRGRRADAEQLVDLVAFACSAPKIGRKSPAPRWISEVRAALDESDRTSVAALARRAGVHPVYLTRLFRECFGCSIREYRMRRRVLRAADLLAARDLPIAMVAASLDFFDQSHLCRDFKAELDVSPSVYRAIVRS